MLHVSVTACVWVYVCVHVYVYLCMLVCLTVCLLLFVSFVPDVDWLRVVVFMFVCYCLFVSVQFVVASACHSVCLLIGLLVWLCLHAGVSVCLLDHV